METQLLTLNPPYKVICNSKGDVGMHIATLLVIDKEESKLTCNNYPVVSYGGNTPAGVTWTEFELPDIMAIEPVKGEIYLRDISSVVKYCYEYGDGSNDTIITLLSNMRYVLKSNEIKVVSSKVKQKNTGNLKDYKIKLDFQEENGIVNVSPVENYYVFRSSYTKGQGEEDAIEEISSLCMLYEFVTGGIEKDRDVIFCTENEDYQTFVDKLNEHFMNLTFSVI